MLSHHISVVFIEILQMSAIKEFLEKNRIEASPNLIEKLQKLGIRDVTDLEHLEHDDLDDEGM